MLAVAVVTPLLITSRCSSSKNRGPHPTSPSIPTMSPTSAALTPRTPCRLPTASPRTNVVAPLNVNATNGRICFSAAETGPAETRSTATASGPTRRIALLDEQPEEQLPERRRVEIAVLQVERFRQPVAVRQEYQGHRPRRQNYDQRRRGVIALPERPHDSFAVVVLHEPAQAVRTAAGRTPRLREHVRGEQSSLESLVELGVLEGRGDEAATTAQAGDRILRLRGALLRVDRVRDGQPREDALVPVDSGLADAIRLRRHSHGIGTRHGIVHHAEALEQAR